MRNAEISQVFDGCWYGERELIGIAKVKNRCKFLACSAVRWKQEYRNRKFRATCNVSLFKDQLRTVTLKRERTISEGKRKGCMFDMQSERMATRQARNQPIVYFERGSKTRAFRIAERYNETA